MKYAGTRRKASLPNNCTIPFPCKIVHSFDDRIEGIFDKV